MKKGFNLEVSSNLNYDRMVVNIVYNPEDINFNDDKKYYVQKQIAILNLDKGVDNIEIELISSQEVFFIFPLEEFQGILEKAKKLLIQVNK
jgi:hypothetical protein